jgi:hypothetical protein
LEESFLTFSAHKIESLCGRIEDCVSMLSAEQAWLRGGEHQNAIGNLMLHLEGNVRQWILTGVCGEPNTRDRDAEFAARGGIAPAELARLLRTAVDDSVARLRSLPHARLADRLTIQGYDVTALEAIAHVVEHFAGHAYQIFFITKMLTGEDLEFYAHLSRRVARSDQVP